MEDKTITFEKIEERLKNKPLNEWTDQDVFDRYIGYGDNNELDNPSVQELLIEHGFTDELINLVDKVIYDDKIINNILNSKIIMKNKYIIRKGHIEGIKFFENKELPNDFIDVVLKFRDRESNIIKIKDLCYLPNKEEYIRDIESYKENNIIISEKSNGIEKKICILKGID